MFQTQPTRMTVKESQIAIRLADAYARLFKLAKQSGPDFWTNPPRTLPKDLQFAMGYLKAKSFVKELDLTGRMPGYVRRLLDSFNGSYPKRLHYDGR